MSINPSRHFTHHFKIPAITSTLLLASTLFIAASEVQAATGDESLPNLSAPSEQAPPTQPQAASPSAFPPANAPASESAYTLGAGDIVRVDIFRVPQYSGESQVLVDGALNLPLVGKVNVNGLNLEQASNQLSREYGRFLRRPLITLSLLNRRELQVGIAGEVNSPGSYTIAQDNTSSSRLSQILERSGGITQSADLSQVQIQRPTGNGGQQLIAVNLWDLIENGNLNQDITLRDGDSIFVPTASQPITHTQASLLADVSFADVSQPINIAIIGEVYRPGPYTLQGGVARTGDAGTPGSGGSSNTPSTVTRALQVAGGIKPKADIRRVQVVRPTRSGTPRVIDVDLWELLQVGDLQQDAILQEGDSIFVPVASELPPEEIGSLAEASFSPDTIRVNVVGEVQKSGTVELPPNTPLSQGILAAGGFNTRASRGSAELVRINEDGTVNRSEIPVDFAEGISEENNPLLQNNDVIIVNRSGLATASDTLGTVLRPLGSLFPVFRFFNIFD